MAATQLTGAYAAIGLSNPKTPANVGGVLRAAGCFGVSLVVTTGQRYTRAPTDVAKAYQSIPLLHVSDLHAAVPFDCVPVAVELTAMSRPLPRYVHPPRAFYVFGPEDNTLPGEILRWCQDVVVIPSNGCLNLAAAVNVLLYDRLAKGLQK